jgi:hypothetical protein
MVSNSAGEFTPQDVISFMSKPLSIGTQIKIVENSMSLKSKASEQALLQELAQGPLGQRLGQDAKVLDKYLKAFGVETFRDKSAAHRDRAERENEAFLDIMRLGFDTEGVAKPLVIFEDDDNIHIDEHTEFITKHWDLVRHNKAFLMEFYIHMETHRLQKEEKEAKLIPGASLQTGTMVSSAASIPAPSVQVVAMDSQQRKMREQEEAMMKANAPGQGVEQTTPNAPGAPPGARPTAPGAPAETTKPAAQQGVGQ